MSLLGKQVYANPTTPIWGQGGGGGGGSNFQNLTIDQGGFLLISSSVNQETQLVFNRDVSGTQYSALAMNYFPPSGQPSNLQLCLTDQSGACDNFLTGDLIAAGKGTDIGAGLTPLVLGYAGTNALGLYQQDATGSNVASYLYINPNTTELNLSNVKTINGVPYAATLTSFDFSNQAGAALAEAPDFTVLNSYSFTAPANGKLYMEAAANLVAATQFGGAGLGFAVGGTTITDSLTLVNAYNSNINLPAMSMYQIPVVGGLTYDISAIAQCSALPPAGPDMVVNTSRLFTVFTPN
jgi:hypothetical protein